MNPTALARSMAVAVDPVRLDLTAEHESAGVRQLALHHADAGRVVHCFVTVKSVRVLAFKLRPDRGSTQVISASTKHSGNHATREALDSALGGALDHAFRGLEFEGSAR